jgi:predicted transcriptional regulator
MKNLVVKDYMIKKTPSVKTTTPMASIVNLLEKSRISGLPVVNDQNEVIGFLSESRCIENFAHNIYHASVTDLVENVMRKDPFTIKDTDTIYETIENLRNTAFNAFIVTRNNKLVGAITRTNVLKALSDNYGHK